MYVDENDCHAYRFLWYEDDDLTKLCMFVMLVHIFGFKASLAITTFVLRYHAGTLSGTVPPEVVEAILRSFYVDDLLHSSPDELRARTFRQGITAALACGGFELTKWRSTSRSVLEDDAPLEEEVITFDDVDVTAAPSEKVLGVSYSFRSNCFSFKVSPEKVANKVKNRREMLSAVASCFDPMGFAAPFILIGKSIFQ